MSPLLSVVIVTHRSAKVIVECLGSVARAAPGAEVIVVDNGSDDETVAWVADSGVEVIVFDSNKGFARAANAGALAARGDLLCFLNPDCRLTGEVVAAARASLDPHALVAAAPRFIHDDGTEIDGRQPGYTARKLLADILETSGARRISQIPRRSARHHDSSWFWPVGACTFIGREPFFALGGFDEAFFLYMEDVVLGRNLAAAGGTTLGLDVSVHHTRARGADVDDTARGRWLDDARIEYARRVHGTGLARALGVVRAVTRALTLRRLR